MKKQTEQEFNESWQGVAWFFIKMTFVNFFKFILIVILCSIISCLFFDDKQYYINPFFYFGILVGYVAHMLEFSKEQPKKVQHS